MFKLTNVSKILFFILLIASVFVSPAVALFGGILLALSIGAPYENKVKKVTKYLLQIAVVGLCFGMNLPCSMAA